MENPFKGGSLMAGKLALALGKRFQLFFVCLYFFFFHMGLSIGLLECLHGMVTGFPQGKLSKSPPLTLHYFLKPNQLTLEVTKYYFCLTFLVTQHQPYSVWNGTLQREK